MLGRNREEQEYLEKLRQIRIQNMKDRRAIRGGNVAEHADNKASEDSEERKKKVEALKLQAEQWAEMKKKELEKQRQGIVPVKPATPVPMTGALQAIGALDGAQNAQAGSQGSAGSLTNAMKAVAGTSPESDRPQSAHQMKKDSILKKLNEKNPARGKWKEPASPAVPEEVDRRRWGAPASPAINAAEEEAPESARSQWGAQKNLHLTNVPLELTGSQMEATSVRDQVIKMNAAGGKDKEVGRSQWGRRSDVVRALDKMPISQDTVTINGSPEAPSPAPQGPPSPAPQGPPVGVGSTITIIQKPPGQGAISGEDGKNLQTARRPLPAPPRSGTIVLSHGSIGVSVPVVDESDSAQVDVKTTPTATEAEDKGKLKNDLTRDGAKSVQMNLTSGNFDLRNVKLLRTISEPDLTSLCAAHADESTAKDSLPVTPATLRRHHSLDLTVVPEGDFDEVDNSPLDAQDDEFAEEDILILANDEDNDSDENEGDDEDDDIRSMRETMQSIIDNSDEEEKDKTLVSLQTSGSETSNKKEHAKKKSRASKKTEEAQNEQPANSKDEEEEEKADDGDDERNDDSDEANLQKQTLADVLKLENEDSDEDSTFGDDDQDGGKGYDDRFGRLEQLRKELETALGVNKLVEVYQVIQKFQEDDEGNIEDGAKEAIKILGASREHLFPKIFQLVMSDTAFQEGKAV
ncbi:unnamed protein product [Lymnaea stagnalis]|uniref:non-specific serine/threonine protein kinase n=1 Tax=Lymnaea stagnalis TaxID=6523 RepID=A0AAV2HYT9_LYMST